jgi:hypothetical protein
MIISSISSILLYQTPVDMRRSIDGLSMIVAQHLQESPTAGKMYVFLNRPCNKIKILYWDRNGFCLCYKRLESDRFKVIFSQGDNSPAGIPMTPAQLRWMLDGLDYRVLKEYASREYQTFY